MAVIKQIKIGETIYDLEVSWANIPDAPGFLPLSGGTIDANGTKTPLILKGGIGDYREGLRIIPSNNWATIMLGGNDIGDQGTSANSWSIHNNNGSFYLSRNGAEGATIKLSNTDGTWKVNNNTIIHSGNIGSQSVAMAEYLNSVASVSGGNTSTYSWRRLMSMGPTTNSYEDRVGTYYLSGNYHDGPWYLFRVEFRTHNSSAGNTGNFKIAVIATNSEVSNLAIASYSVATNGVTTSYADVFVKVGTYPRMTLTRLSASDKGIITYYNSNEGNNASSRIEAYKDINGSGAGYASYDLHDRSSYPVVTNGVLTATVWRAGSISDIGNNQTTTFAYSKDRLGYDNFTWLAAWNGYELRAVDKSQFARENHTHSQYYNTSNLGNTTFKVTRSASQSTATTGYWAAMVKSDQTGNPVLPSKAKWWHVISMDWTGTDYNNWFSQLALPTQDGGVPHYRRNNSGGTTIDSSTWHSFITDENIGLQSVNKANLISPHQNVTTTEKSTWDPTNSGKIIWGQRFINSSISSESGDLTLFLRGANGGTELCMNIDGDYYSNGHKIARADHTHDKINTAFVFNNSDIPEGAANLGLTTSAHKMTFYRNGLCIPYQMDNANDGGILRCRGNSESSTIVELGTWDDSGAGETIQFNYYSTGSQATPAHSVSVPKKSGTIALTSDIPGAATQSANGLMSSADKKKLDGIAEGANKIIVDSSLNSSSTNPVQNMVIYAALAPTIAYDNNFYSWGESGSWRFMQNNASANSLDIRYGTIPINSQNKTYDVSFGSRKFNNGSYTVVFGLLRSDRDSWFWSPLVKTKSNSGFTVYVRGNTSGDNVGTLMYLAIKSN